MSTRPKGESWFGRIYAKVPRTADDYEALVIAEIKRGRKNAKRLRNQKGNTK